jgi:hypothetical protein
MGDEDWDVTNADVEQPQRSEASPRRGPAWSIGLSRLAEDLEAFTARLLDAQRELRAQSSPAPPARRSDCRSAPPARRRPGRVSSLRERLDATERLVARLEQERRHDGAGRVVALTDAARRLEHAQRTIELSQHRLAAENGFPMLPAGPAAQTVASPSATLDGAAPAPPAPPGDLPANLAARAEQAVLRVQQLESQLADWGQGLAIHADLLERVAGSVRELEVELARREDIELHVAMLIERLSGSLARVPVY